MIQTNKLRVGNTVGIGRSLKQCEVKAVLWKNRVVLNDRIMPHSYLDIHPIQLTSKILFEKGFSVDWGCGHYRFNDIYLVQRIIENGNYLVLPDSWFDCFVGGVKIGEVQYLHQLQNLYFAITQSELPALVDS